MNEGQFAIVIYKDGGDLGGVDRVLASNDSLSVALSLYNLHCIDQPDRLTCSAMARASFGEAIASTDAPRNSGRCAEATGHKVYGTPKAVKRTTYEKPQGH